MPLAPPLRVMTPTMPPNNILKTMICAWDLSMNALMRK